MEKMIIHGGAPLRGTVTLSGSKNAALPIMMAARLWRIRLGFVEMERALIFFGLAWRFADWGVV
jgi:UDP-N-acetylglucosamine 1-carboxyvinyltransferase